MKKFIETIRNIFKIEDLKNRIGVTLLLVLVYRLGSFIVIPGIDPAQLQNLAASTEKNGILGLIDMFSGGAFSNASIFALGIMPYITASIVIQLLGIAVPYFQRLQKEGESGRRKINQITRYLTVVVLIMQSSGFLAGIYSMLPDQAFILDGWTFRITTTIILTAGSMFVMWLGERITDRGIGNGISLIIMVGIIARLPQAIIEEFGARGDGGGLIVFVLEFVVLFFVFMGSIALVQGTRRIPVQYAKRIVGNKQYGGVRQYIPLKVNAAGVMPIIFAQAILFLPITIAGFMSNGGDGFMSKIGVALSNHTGFWYNLTQFLLVVMFTYFYTAITVNPVQMAEDMKKNGGFIPGIKPGKKTVEYLDTIMSRITLPGSMFLGLITILPSFAMMAGVSTQFSYFFGGTSLLILVGVVLDTLQQIESHLLMRHYDGLMKSGRIKGRSGGAY